VGFVRSAFRGSSSSSLSTPEKWVEDWFSGGGSNPSGAFVSEETALHYAPFFAGVQIIAGDIGGLPLPVYERLERGKRRAFDHPLYPVLHDQANPYMTAVAFRETMQGHALTWKGGYAYIERNGAGQVESLWPLNPSKIKPCKIHDPDGRGKFTLFYRYTDPNGRQSILLPDEVLPISGLGGDGIEGYSLVSLARGSIGLGMATERYGSAFFANGSRPGGVLTHPARLSDPARERMRADWENLHRGLDRASRVAILEEGVQWHQIGIPPEDAQFLETRRFQVTEMARWLRIPPHKISDLERATFTNIEHQGLDYVTSTLRIWLVRWEQALLMRLFTMAERRRFFSEHLVDALLRGDIKSRYEAYAIARNWGWMSADDVLERENGNPLPDGRGEVYLVPLNMVPAPRPDEEPSVPERMARAMRGRGAEARRRTAATFAPLIADADARLAKLERAEVASLVRRHLQDDDGRGARLASPAAFLAAVWRLYDTTIRAKTVDRWTAPLQALMVEIIADAIADVGFDGEVDLGRWLGAYIDSHADYRVNSAYGQIRAELEKAGADGDAAAAAVLALLDTWVDERPQRTADWQTSQLPNATARETYKAAGIRAVRWVTEGDSCPYCVALDGREVGIDDAFATKGDELDGDGDEHLTVKRTIRHPPLHPKCNCGMAPA
jgi:HK97 family phage portal protein